MTLSEDERRRIEEEERFRVEARLRAEAEAKVKFGAETEAKKKEADPRATHEATGHGGAASTGQFFKAWFMLVGLCVFLSVAHFVVGGDDSVPGQALGWLAFVAWGFAALLFYFIPSIVAAARKHPQIAAIAVTNLLLGWIIIGWIIALIWAVKAPATLKS